MVCRQIISLFPPSFLPSSAAASTAPQACSSPGPSSSSLRHLLFSCEGNFPPRFCPPMQPSNHPSDHSQDQTTPAAAAPPANNNALNSIRAPDVFSLNTAIAISLDGHVNVTPSFVRPLFCNGITFCVWIIIPQGGHSYTRHP